MKTTILIYGTDTGRNIGSEITYGLRTITKMDAEKLTDRTILIASKI